LKIRFKYRPVLLLAMVACFTAIAIGNFQRSRAEQKQNAFDRIEGARYDAPIQVGAALVDAAILDKHPANARGHWLADRTVLIDNKVHNGVAGYHVITPLRIEGTSLCILVNRGWIAAPRLRSELPTLPAVRESRVDVIGIAHSPSGKVFELAPDHSKGRVWQHLALDRFREWSGLTLQPIILLQTDEVHDGLVRDWRPSESGALKHWGFAIVWYLAAAAAAAGGLVASMERRKPDE